MSTSQANAASEQHAIIGVGTPAPARAFQPNTHPATRWFDDGGNFGLFIHWGLASVHGGTDLSWGYIKNTPWGRASEVSSKITPAEYYQLAERFNPQSYNPRRWLQAAKDAGATYAVFTTKHHDGFTFWPTASSEIGVHTHLGHRDFVRPYVEACREVGLKVGLYYSPPDWYFERKYLSFEYESFKALEQHRRNPGSPAPSVQPYGWHHEPVELPPHPDDFNERFAAKVRTQVEELLTRYGQIDLLWFDGRPYTLGTPGEITIERIRELQPGILVNPRLFETGDYEAFECHWPKTRPAGRWEHATLLHSGGWGYHERAEFYPSAHRVADLERARAWGGNYLANSGLGPDGDMPEAYYNLMDEIRDLRGLPAPSAGSPLPVAVGTNTHS